MFFFEYIILFYTNCFVCYFESFFLNHYLSVINIINLLLFSTTMVFIGFLGLTFSKKTTIHLMLCVELIFIGNFLSIIFAGVCLHTYEIASAAYIYSLYILTVAASESAIGLSILIVNYRFHGSIALSRLHTLNG